MIQLLTQALILYCELNTIGYAYKELKKYLATSTIAQAFNLSGYTEDELTVRPLNSAAHAKYAQLSSPEEFFACFQMILPTQDENDIPAYRAKICGHYNLYQFPAFIAFIRPFPEYPNHILELAARIKRDKKFHECLSHMQGFDKHGLCRFIKQECAVFSLDAISMPCC